MEKESKVISVQGNGTWNGKDGTLFYRYEVAFENGDSGEYSSKSAEQNKFIIGQIAKYTVISNQYGNKIKPVWNQSSTGGYGGKKSNPETSQQIARMNALGHAMTMLAQQHITPTQVESTANKFYTYITTGKMEVEAEGYHTYVPTNPLS